MKRKSPLAGAIDRTVDADGIAACTNRLEKVAEDVLISRMPAGLKEAIERMLKRCARVDTVERLAVSMVRKAAKRQHSLPELMVRAYLARRERDERTLFSTPPDRLSAESPFGPSV